MRIRVPKRAAAAAIAAISFAGRASAADVTWHAPASCADPRQTREEAERLLGRSLGSVRVVDFEVTIVNHGVQRWVLTLTTVARGSGQRRERVLKGGSCSEVTSAAAVAMAMAVDLGESPAPDASATAEPSAEPTRAEPSPARAPAPSAQPPPPRARSSRASAAMSLSLAGDLGSLPGAAAGGELGASFRYSQWQLSGLGALYADADRRADGKGADLVLAVFGLLGCGRAENGAVRPLICAGAESGWLSGTGIGVKNPRTAAAFWVAARAEAGVAVPVGGGFSLLVRGGASVPLIRREFVVGGDVVVHQPKRLAGRLTLGVELAL